MAAGWLGLAALALPARAQAPAPVVPGPGRVLDRVVAEVEGRAVTQSELEFEARVALVQRGALQAATAPLDEQTLRGALDLSVAERLQVLDADRLQAFPAEQSEVQARVTRFKGRFPTPAAFEAFLARHEADEAQLAALLERGVRAERILDSRIRLRAQVTEVELRRYYDAHRAELDGPYEAVRGVLRERLGRERYQRLAAAELAQLQRGARVRRVAPFARAGAEGGRP